MFTDPVGAISSMLFEIAIIAAIVFGITNIKKSKNKGIKTMIIGLGIIMFCETMIADGVKNYIYYWVKIIGFGFIVAGYFYKEE